MSIINIRNIIESHLSEKEAEEFAEWAFGEDFKEFDIRHKSHIRWNQRWGHILELKSNGDPNIDIPKMIHVWKRWLIYDPLAPINED